MTDAEIIAAVAADDANAAFEYIYRRSGWAATLYRLVAAKHSTLADTVVQETMIKFFENLKANKFKGDGTLKAYFAGIGRKRLADQLRREHRRIYHHTQFAQRSPVVENRERGRDYLDAVLYHLRLLPEKKRRVVELRAYGYKHHEIAELMALSEAVSRNYYQQAKAKLRQQVCR